MLYCKMGGKVKAEGDLGTLCTELMALVRMVYELSAEDFGKETARILLAGIGRAAVNKGMSPQEASGELLKENPAE